MFEVPKYPPKDYILKEVPQAQKDSSQFTPDAQPRVTQNTVGVFCSPVHYTEGEVPDKLEPTAVNPRIINKWIDDAKAFWVDEPGKTDLCIHNIFQKFSSKVDRHGHNNYKQKVFNRSFKYELEWLEENRLQKLHRKCEKEAKEFGKSACVPRAIISETYDNAQVAKSTIDRWTEEPNLTAIVIDDPCRRKHHMLMVGQPFKTEACNFYYRHYPPPDVKFTPKKLTEI
ncbi:uncharacterized protein LOC132698372 [Cylas formicarius]|uniref:uncharacterized protein LOC132698372 n=1 Tax=Cylas formicarius TaxID=197179 RepID=UPI002958C5F0|nr:uncharacterized protein LOC132698372 [Cylas formicarius]